MDTAAAVRDYLRRHFPEHEVTASAPDGTVYRLRRGDLAYEVHLHPDLLAQPPDALLSQLDDWHLPAELCRAEDLPLLVTPHGIRLESSN